MAVKEIARLMKVSPRGAANAISVAIASGIIERDGRGLRNLHILQGRMSCLLRDVAAELAKLRYVNARGATFSASLVQSMVA
jgi:hypothetical protein